MAQLVLLDAGPLVAMLDKRDQWHEWSTSQMRQVQSPLLTCEAVISEASFLLHNLPAAIRQLDFWVKQGLITLVPLGDDGFARTLTLMQRYANVPMSFADACLVVLSEEHRAARVFTLDSDFAIYRREDDSAIPVLAPYAE